MIKPVTQDTYFCDVCLAEQRWGCGHCIRCGKHICSKCTDSNAVEYRHSVNCMGSGDGMYCTACNSAMERNPDSLFLAYLRIASLRAEAKRFNDDFEIRRTLAEDALKKIQRGDHAR